MGELRGISEWLLASVLGRRVGLRGESISHPWAGLRLKYMLGKRALNASHPRVICAIRSFSHTDNKHGQRRIRRSCQFFVDERPTRHIPSAPPRQTERQAQAQTLCGCDPSVCSTLEIPPNVMALESKLTSTRSRLGRCQNRGESTHSGDKARFSRHFQDSLEAVD